MDLDRRMNEIFEDFSDKAKSLYKFIILYNNWISTPHDYGTGILLNMLEIHILTDIEENQGITITELSKIWAKSKGSVSQIVSSLVERGLVYKVKREGNNKTTYLYPTDEGIKLSQTHKVFDAIDITKTLHELLKTCTFEEINGFFKVIEVYNQLL